MSDTSLLPSWNPGTARSAIIDFVDRVTDETSADFVPPSHRIATFDNDGTLWCEFPMQVQVFFLFDRLKQLVTQDPALATNPAYRAFLDRDHAAIAALGSKGILEVAFATHAGMTLEEFDQLARSWFQTAKHPTTGRLFKLDTYQPQVELLNYLRSNQFKTFIVSGGGIDLIRSFAEEAYGIPPEQVVGSSVKTRFEDKDGRIEILKLAELASFDDREAKVENIGLHIGRRPVLAFGNSDGDLAMLRYTLTGDGPRLGLLLHHDDAAREFAYDREFRLSPLTKALDDAQRYGIHVVSMKNDWNTVFIEST